MHRAFCFHFTAARQCSSMASVPVFCRDFWAGRKKARAGQDDLECAPRLPGCGTQHPLRALGGTCVLLAAAPTTPPCFRRWRRSSLLQRKNYFRASGATAFAERSVAMKAPVGLLSGRAVCVSRWRGFAPTSSADAPLAHFHRRGRKGKRHLPQSKQKAPEGGCSPGKKGLMILYLFVVVGVLDLERNCHVTMLAVALNNNTNVRPIAILADVNIPIGIDPL